MGTVSVLELPLLWRQIDITATSATTIELLPTTFTVHGLPNMLVTDNGSIFISKEFMWFNGVKQVTTSSNHPASGGLVERAVQTVKEGLKKLSSRSIQARVSRFLFEYHSTSTGKSPVELLLGRRLRSHLDLTHPRVDKHVLVSQERQKAGHDQHTKARVFYVGDGVYAWNFSRGPCSQARGCNHPLQRTSLLHCDVKQRQDNSPPR